MDEEIRAHLEDLIWYYTKNLCIARECVDQIEKKFIVSLKEDNKNER